MTSPRPALDDGPACLTQAAKGMGRGVSDVFEPYKLDRFTRVTPSSLLAVFVPPIVLLGFLGFRDRALFTAIGLLVAGYVFWTFFEYWIHRLVFHFEPQQPVLSRLHWMAHGHHHTKPRDPFRLFFPLIFSIPVSGICLAIFVALFGAARGWSFGAGFLFGYVAMDMTHFMLHRKKPKNRVGRLLYERHMRHHFDDEEQGFGVSGPLWDLVFGTYGRRLSSRQPAMDTSSQFD